MKPTNPKLQSKLNNAVDLIMKDNDLKLAFLMMLASEAMQVAKGDPKKQELIQSNLRFLINKEFRNQ